MIQVTHVISVVFQSYVKTPVRISRQRQPADDTNTATAHRISAGPSGPTGRNGFCHRIRRERKGGSGVPMGLCGGATGGGAEAMESREPGEMVRLVRQVPKGVFRSRTDSPVPSAQQVRSNRCEATGATGPKGHFFSSSGLPGPAGRKRATGHQGALA